jgi:hypothetical protein
MDSLFKFGANIYAYCTNFIINLANLFGISYYEINGLIFCILWPIITVLLIVLFVIIKLRYNYLKSLNVKIK